MNPGGVMGVGVVVYEDRVQVAAISKQGLGNRPHTSSNLAEFLALHEGIQWVIENQKSRERIVFYGDSEFVIRHTSGRWKINPKIYAEGARMVRRALLHLPYYELRWIPREENTEADLLSDPEKPGKIDALTLEYMERFK